MKSAATLLTAALLVYLAGCSSAPKSSSAPEGAPAWITQPARTVDGGYIVYVASSTDRSPDQARFRAEGAALQDIANECSFAPKGARVEDRYDGTVGVLHQAYAKAAVSFADCEQAQAAVDPAQVRKLANVALTDEVKRYQDAIDHETAQTDEDEEEGEEEAPTYAPSSRPVVIHDTVGFFVVRQQVAFAKEVVILAPPTAYAPGAPETRRFVDVVQPATGRVHAFATANPSVRSSSASWSSLPERPAVPALGGINGVRATRAYSPAKIAARASSMRRYNRGKQSKAGRKRKKRRWNY